MADSIKKLQKCMPQLEHAVWTHKESQHKSQIWFHTCFTPDLVMGKSLPLIDPRCNHQNFIISILLYLHSGGGLWLTPRVWIRKVITRSFQSSLPLVIFSSKCRWGWEARNKTWKKTAPSWMPCAIMRFQCHQRKMTLYSSMQQSPK